MILTKHSKNNQIHKKKKYLSLNNCTVISHGFQQKKKWGDNKSNTIQF